MSDRPQGVRLVRANGSVMPIELSDGGIVDDVHVWRVAESTVLHPGDTVQIDLLPPHCRVEFPTTAIERRALGSRARACWRRK